MQLERVERKSSLRRYTCPQDVLVELADLQVKSLATYQKVQGTLDKLIELYHQCEVALQKGQSVADTAQLLNQQLILLKPIKTVNGLFTHFYNRLSSFGKQLSLTFYGDAPPLLDPMPSVREPSNEGKVNSTANLPIDTEEIGFQRVCNFFGKYVKQSEVVLLEQLLCEHFMRNGRWKEAEIFERMTEKEGMEVEARCSLQARKHIFQECHRLRTAILEGAYSEPIQWCLGKDCKQHHLMEYRLKKMHTIELIQADQEQPALVYIEQNLTKFYEAHEVEIALLIGYCLFRSQFKHRYEIFQKEPHTRASLGSQFVRHFLRSHLISEIDGVKIVHDLGESKMGQYDKFLSLVDYKYMQKVLPFSVVVPKECRFHSLFMCPISKEVISSQEGVTMLSCGHLLSKSAIDRIQHENRSRRSQRCPVCQKEIDATEAIPVRF